MILRPVSPSEVLKRSKGEVTTDKLFNFKYTIPKPEEDGLFSQRIFGCLRDYECACGKYKGQTHSGKTCESCRVTITHSYVRSHNMGHIDLKLHIIHPLTERALYKVLEQNLSTVIRGVSNIKIVENENGRFSFNKEDGTVYRGDILHSPDLPRLDGEFNNGPEAIYRIVEKINVEETLTHSIIHKLKFYYNKGFDIRNLFLIYLPIQPPSHRPISFTHQYAAASPKNALYQRIVRRMFLIRRLTELEAPKIILEQSNKMMQKAVNDLFLGGSSDGKIPLHGIMENFGGKQGLLRGSLLGKRTDFSGRSVIIAASDKCGINDIGIPRKMAYELFKPFIISKLLDNYVEGIKEAESAYEAKSFIAIKCLEDV